MHLLDAGADMERADGKGRTALGAAARAGQEEVVRSLCARRADVAALDAAGDAALAMAARGTQLPIRPPPERVQ